jgi:DNA-directed RNA polymerase I subunit RPA2
VAEKLNFFRYLSHFRSVHRGAYFTEMRTTTVRKLLPESWGFMCPVHTPDGSPCGLLNHMSAACKVVTADPADPEQTAMALAQVRAWRCEGWMTGLWHVLGTCAGDMC